MLDWLCEFCIGNWPKDPSKFCSFYFDKGHFSEFFEEAKPLLSSLKLTTVIECICKAANAPIFLLVDELIKSAGPAEMNPLLPRNPMLIAHAVGMCLDSLGEKFNAVISTLDRLPLDELTPSGREVNLVPLPPLSQKRRENCLSMLNTIALYNC